jgi:hypothetical protein
MAHLSTNCTHFGCWQMAANPSIGRRRRITPAFFSLRPVCRPYRRNPKDAANGAGVHSPEIQSFNEVFSALLNSFLCHATRLILVFTVLVAKADPVDMGILVSADGRPTAFGALSFYGCETEPERVLCHQARHRATSESISKSGEIAHADDLVSLSIASKAWYRTP